MLKPIVKDIFFLRRKAEEATREDIQIGIDLQDTLRANKEACVGMAANMIGVNKRYENIEGEYLDMNWKKQKQKLSGWTAQICQHELDHLEGIII